MEKRSIQIVTVVLALVLAGGALLVVGLCGWLHSPAGQAFVRDRLNASIPGDFAWDRAYLSCLQVGVVLEGVHLRAPDGRDLAHAARLRLSIEPAGLLFGRIVLRELILEEPHFHLRQAPDGSIDLLQALTPPRRDESERRAEKAPLIRELRIVQGCLHAGQEASGRMLLLEGIDLQGRLDLGRRAGRVRLAAASGTIASPDGNLSIGGLELAAALKDGRLELATLSLETPASHANLEGRVQNLFSDPQIELALTGAFELREAAGLMPGLGPASGSLSVRGRLEGGLENPQVSLTLDYAGGTLRSWPLGSGRLAGRLKDHFFTIETLELMAFSGRAIAHGKLDLTDVCPGGVLRGGWDPEQVRYELSAIAEEIDLSKLSRGGVGLSGRGQARLSARGRGLKPAGLEAALEAALSLRQLHAPTPGMPHELDLHAQANIAGGLIEVRVCEAQAPGLEVRGSGHYRPASREVQARVHGAARQLEGLTAWAGFAGLGGAAALDLNLSGVLPRPQGEARLTVQALSYRGRPLGRLDARARLDNQGTLHLEGLELAEGHARLRASGLLGLFGEGLHRDTSGPLQLIASVHALDLARLFPDRLARGTLDGDLKVTGRLKNPSAQANLSLAGLATATRRIGDVASNIRLEEGRLSLNRLELINGRSILRAQGHVDLLDRLTGKLEADPAFAVTLESRPLYLEDFDDAWRGNLALEARLHGRRSQPQGRLSLLGNALGFGPQEVGRLEIGAVLEGHRLDLAPFRVELAPGGVVIGQGWITREKAFACELKAAGIELAHLKLRDVPLSLQGLLSGTLRAEGNVDVPSRMRAVCEIEGFELQGPQAGRVLIDTAKLSLSEGVFRWEPLAIKLGEGARLDVEGRADLAGKLDLRVQGDIPLALLTPFITELGEPEGVAHLRAHITGTRIAPAVEAQLDLEGLSFLIVPLGQRIHDTSGRIRIRPEGINLAAIGGQLDTGSFNLEGSIAFADLRPKAFDVRLVASALPLHVPERADMVLNATLALQGTSTRPLVLGELVLLEGTYWRDVQLKPSIGAPVTPDASGRRLPGGPLLDRTALDIYVTRLSPLRIENNLAELEIHPDLNIQGTLAAPVIVGRVESREGTLFFGGRDFFLTRGVIDFVNPYRTEARFDLEGETYVRDWTISLNITGPSDNLVFALSSNPAASDGDIMALLVFGKTTAELMQPRAGRDLVNPGLLAEVLSQGFGRDLKQVTGLDTAKIEQEVTDEGERTRVVLGKELSRRVRVEYVMENTMGQLRQEASAEYRLLENLLIDGFQDSLGIYGAEIQYRLEFR